MRKPRLFDIEDKGPMEHNQVEYLQNHVYPGDDVCIIGGGRGITATVAARRTSPEGSVKVYEADIDMAEQCRRTLSLNNTPDVVTIEERSVGDVGQTSDIMGFDARTRDLERISPENLPECDVLEIDVEGAEKHIIPNLGIRPSIIILEVHPSAGYSEFEAKGDLQELGYKIVDKSEEDKNVPVLLAKYDT